MKLAAVAYSWRIALLSSGGYLLEEIVDLLSNCAGMLMNVVNDRIFRLAGGTEVMDVRAG